MIPSVLRFSCTSSPTSVLEVRRDIGYMHLLTFGASKFVGTTISPIRPTSFILHQGSVLPFLFFLLYVLDISDALELGVRLIIYADDIVVSV